MIPKRRVVLLDELKEALEYEERWENVEAESCYNWDNTYLGCRHKGKAEGLRSALQWAENHCIEVKVGDGDSPILPWLLVNLEWRARAEREAQKKLGKEFDATYTKGYHGGRAAMAEAIINMLIGEPEYED